MHFYGRSALFYIRGNIYLLVKMHISERVANFVCIFTVGPLCWACLGRLFIRGWPFFIHFYGRSALLGHGSVFMGGWPILYTFLR